MGKSTINVPFSIAMLHPLSKPPDRNIFGAPSTVITLSSPGDESATVTWRAATEGLSATKMGSKTFTHKHMGVSENSCQTGKVNAARKCHLFQHQGAMRQPSSLRAGSRALWYKWDNGGNGVCISCQVLHFSICATCVTGKLTRPPYDICVHLSKIIPSKFLYQHGLLQTANERNFALLIATRLPSGGF